ncbi:tRNA (guanosine(46)-N7)-methyltransferase TrmB [Peptostreptococcaceae bacterium AGR-M142]
MRFRRSHYSHLNLLDYDAYIDEPQNYKGKWKEVFSNNNELEIEIGCGKGKFIIEHALRNPNKNYIAIEKVDVILALCGEKIKELGLKNIKILNYDANKLEEIFEKGEVSKIYLNFSDPWPKNKHQKRRLTHSKLLNVYYNFLKDESYIEFKTDNRNLFEFSINEFIINENYNLESVSLDLHRDEDLSKDIITTEYEDKFKNMGNEIYKLVSKKV